MNLDVFSNIIETNETIDKLSKDVVNFDILNGSIFNSKCILMKLEIKILLNNARYN